MLDIVALLECLCPYLTATTVGQLSRLMGALLAMTGRVTMLGIARWAGQGGSYRTVQRFFYTVISWPVLFWVFCRRHVLDPTDTYILAGDECVVTKAGKKTYGLDRFFSSLYGKPVPGLSFFALSLISRNERRSYPIRVEQMLRTEAEKATAKTTAHKNTAKHQNPQNAQSRKPGRPKGSQNREKTHVVLSPELQRTQTMIQKQLEQINGAIPLAHIVLDGKFGNHPALHMVRGCGLHLISKLRHDAALYCPYEGPYAGRGPRRKYGSKLAYRNIPMKYLKQTTVEDNIQTNIYQAKMWHKEFAKPLNVVILVKMNPKTQAYAHVVLFSSDLELSDEQLIDYYSLRFQIEFNFRDAKQYWGLEDFMNVQPTAVNNAANLSLFMVTVAHLLVKPFRKDHPQFGILDLKASFRGYKYVSETLKLLPQKPEPILMARIFDQMARLGSVHNAEPALNMS
jgi:putative transposase